MWKSMKFFVILIFVTASLAAVALADDGTATYYVSPYVASACYGYQDEGNMIAAASDAFWNNGAVCGQYYTVTCTGGTNQGDPYPCTGQSVVVKIVDYCPSGCSGTIDLSQEAFAVIANNDAGKVTITYTQN